MTPPTLKLASVVSEDDLPQSIVGRVAVRRAWEAGARRQAMLTANLLDPQVGE